MLSSALRAKRVAVGVEHDGAAHAQARQIGAEKARNASEPTLRTMYDRMGFVMPASGRFFGAARPKGL